jgi:hypothetical protein
MQPTVKHIVTARAHVHLALVRLCHRQITQIQNDLASVVSLPARTSYCRALDFRDP